MATQVLSVSGCNLVLSVLWGCVYNCFILFLGTGMCQVHCWPQCFALTNENSEGEKEVFLKETFAINFKSEIRWFGISDMAGFLQTVTLCYAQDVTWEQASPEQARLQLVASEVPEVALWQANPDMPRGPSDTRLHVPNSFSVYAISARSGSHPKKVLSV